MTDILKIDGTYGEGGGQILRSALSLSAITGKPFEIVGIRGGRKKDGLLRQHLTCVRAAQAVCDARVEGDELRSVRLLFEPQALRSGHFKFAVGSAGSASLVLQTMLYPLLMAEGESRVTVSGGTHNRWAPTYDFLLESFLPQLRKMGAEVSLELVRPGFFPAGGGTMNVVISPWKTKRALKLMERGELIQRRCVVSQAHVPGSVAVKEHSTFKRCARESFLAETVDYPKSVGPGNVMSAHVEYENLTTTITSFGERGTRAEKVAKALASDVAAYLEQGAPVCEYLADQLILPMAFAGGKMKVAEWSLHAKTNVCVVEQFLPEVEFRLEEDANGFEVQTQTSLAVSS